MEKFMKLGIKTIIYIFIGLVVFVVALSSTFTVSAGQLVMEQTPAGKLIPHMDPGIKFKVPFLSKIDTYNEVTTVTYSQSETSSTSSNAPYDITFADTYGGLIKGSFRIEMPKDPEMFKKLHRAFKNYDNLVDNGVEKFTNELLAYTANQFTGEAFMQGGQNEYKSKLKQQALGGLFVTKRTAVSVDRQAANVSLLDDKASKTNTVKQMVYLNVIQRDANGVPLREANPMAKYGIKVTQVTIDGFIPEPDLEKFINNKKDMVQKRVRLIEDQENERQSAITAKLKGDRERIQAKQAMLREKDAAVISADKEVALAKKAAEREKVDRQKLADLAIIDKKKQLQIAKANEGIQQATYKAKLYEAKSIVEIGFAQAKVATAKLKAKMDNSKVYLAELQRDIVIQQARSMENTKLDAPDTVIINGAGGTTSTSDLLNLKLVQDITSKSTN